MSDLPDDYYLPISVPHSCGAQGYDPMLGDTCSGCEHERLHPYIGPKRVNPRYSTERVALLEAVSEAAKWLRSTAEYQREAIDRYEAAEADLAAYDRTHGIEEGTKR